MRKMKDCGIESKNRIMKIDSEQFALVCFLSLMQGGDGLLGKHPDYIREKMVILKTKEDAYGFLDRPNQERVLAWINEWGLELPDAIGKYEEEFKDF